MNMLIARYVRISGATCLLLSMLSTLILLLYSHGPVPTLNVYGEVRDTYFGRMEYEPEIPINWTDTEWVPEQHRDKWTTCTNKPCTSGADRSQRRRSIPKRIHQMYKTTDIPKNYVTYVESWLKNHPDYEYWFWDNNEILLFVMDHYPEYLSLYESYPFNIQRSDMARYLILEKYGGVYCDLDYKSLKPVDDLIKNRSCIFSHEPTVQTLLIYNEEIMLTNAIMACAQNHPIFNAVIRTLSSAKEFTERKRGKFLIQVDGRWSIYLTGPFILSRVYYHYTAFQCCQNFWDLQVHLVPYKKLSPGIDAQKTEFYKQGCAEIENQGTPHDILIKQRKACREFLEEDSHPSNDDAYAIHDWLHIGYKNSNNLATVSIFDVVKDRNVYIYSKNIRGQGAM